MREPFARAFLEPDIGALLVEGLFDAFIHARVDKDLMRPLLDEDGDRHAPGALARDDPVGPILDHAGDAVLARRRRPLRASDFFKRDGAQGGLVSANLTGSVRSASYGLFYPRPSGPFPSSDEASSPYAARMRVRLRERLVHRDEPLRRIAEDHRLLRTPAECGYWCFRRPRAMRLFALISSAMTASLASPFSPFSVSTRLPSKPGASLV